MRSVLAFTGLFALLFYVRLRGDTLDGARSRAVSLLDNSIAALLQRHKAFCTQEAPLEPGINQPLWRTVERLLHSQTFVNKTAHLLGGAVRIPLVVIPTKSAPKQQMGW